MRSVVSTEFRRQFSKLPKEIQEQVRSAYALWRQNPNHPGLDFKKLKVVDAFSARIGMHYRTDCVKVADDVVVWEWIGTHAEYDRLIREMR